MNYWARRIIEEEAKANAIASKAVAQQRAYLHLAQRKLQVNIAELQAQILSKGAEPTRTTLWNYGKYWQLQNAIEGEIGATGARQIGLLDDAAAQVFSDTLGTLVEELDGSSLNFQFLGESSIKQYIRQPWNGADYSTRVWNNTKVLAHRVKQLVDDALILGLGSEQLTERLMKEFGTSYNVANRLIRTELSHTFNSASLLSYEEAGIAEVEVLVAADERLCDTCSSAAGIYPIHNKPLLPLHPRCRCCYAPVVGTKE